MIFQMQTVYPSRAFKIEIYSNPRREIHIFDPEFSTFVQTYIFRRADRLRIQHIDLIINFLSLDVFFVSPGCF